MLVLIEDLLDFEKINAGMLELGTEEFALKQLFEDAGEAVREYLTDLTIAVELTGEPETLFVKADLARMQQVIAKLLTALAVFSGSNGAAAR